MPVMQAQNRAPMGVPRYRHEAIAVCLQVRGITTGEPTLSVLVYQRERAPFCHAFALPSGPVGAAESLNESMLRHLADKVGVDQPRYLEQLETTADPHRDPNERTIATSYLVLLAWDDEPLIPNNAKWLNIDQLPELAFDHGGLVYAAVCRLRAKLSYTNIGFALAPQAFTLAALRDCYSAALDYPVSATNLQRVLTRRDQLEPTGAVVDHGSKGGRPARRFRFTQQRLEVTDPSAVLRRD